MKMTTYFLSAAALLGLGLASIAHAGTRYSNYDLLIDSVAHTASGAVSAVRNTPDNIARIECGIDATANGISMFCWGQNASEKSAFCFSSSPTLVQAAATIHSDSFIRFHWDDAGQCTRLEVFVESAVAPKLH